MRRLMGLALLLGLSTAGATAQINPGQAKPKPLDPNDVAVLTGRPQPKSLGIIPRPSNAAAAQINAAQGYTEPEDIMDPKARRPLDPADVDILTGKYDREYAARYRADRYRSYPYEQLWWANWAARSDHRNSSFFSEDGSFYSDSVYDRSDPLRRHARPFLFHDPFRNRVHQPFFSPRRHHRGSFFFFVP